MQTLFRALAGTVLLCAALIAIAIAHAQGATAPDEPSIAGQAETVDWRSKPR